MSASSSRSDPTTYTSTVARAWSSDLDESPLPPQAVNSSIRASKGSSSQRDHGLGGWIWTVDLKCMASPFCSGAHWMLMLPPPDAGLPAPSGRYSVIFRDVLQKLLCNRGGAPGVFACS